MAGWHVREKKTGRLLCIVPDDALVLTLRLDRDILTATVTEASEAVIASADAAYETQEPEPGFAEQRAEDWWEAARAAIDALPAEARDGVRAIRIAGDLRAIVFLDGEGEPIRPAILAEDDRAAEGAASVLQWLRQHQTIAYKRVRHLTTARGYVRLRLTGTMALDPEDAASTGLLEEGGRSWSARRCEEGEVNADILPMLAASTFHQTTADLLRP